MKYKVGDKVQIKSLDWYNENKDENIDFNTPLVLQMTSKMSLFCDDVVTIKEVNYNYYSIYEDNNTFCWTDEMIEGLVEEETNDCEKCGLTRNSTGCLFMDNCPNNKQKNIIEVPEDYVLKDENGNVINATKIVLEKKKKEYPKTFEECVHVLEGEIRTSLEQMNTFRKLIDARNAYWKIAGEQMGLGKPWEPDWTSENLKYCICVFSNKIVFDAFITRQQTFSFPTKEMRDAFKQNFDPDIEICKEFL